MAKLTASRDSFIAMLLEVSGRARPRDLQGVSLDESAELLRAYVEAHPELPLSFADDELVIHAAPSPATAPPVAVDPFAVVAPTPVEPQAASAPAEAWTFGDDATFVPQVSDAGDVIGYDFSAPPVSSAAPVAGVPPVTAADFAGAPAYHAPGEVTAEPHAASAPSGEFVIPAPGESDFEPSDFVELPGMPQDRKRGSRGPLVSMPVLIVLGVVVVIAILGALYAMGMLDSVIGSLS